MPKKSQMSGFLLFMLEYKKREEKSGHKFPQGLRDVQADPQCSKEWNALSAPEKKEYNQRAKMQKGEYKAKMTTLGETLSVVQERDARKRAYEDTMRTEVEKTILSAEQTGVLESLSFFFIHVNHFYTKVDLDATVDYIPAEFAIIEFSLGEGIKRIYHQIIKTQIEMGYTRECYEHRDASHKIPNDLDEGESDYGKIYRKFTDFLTNGVKGANNFPEIYTLESMRTIVPCLFNRMLHAVGYKVTENPMFKLYSLEYLFGTLMYYTDEYFPKVGNRAIIAQSELSKEAFIYVPEIECFYHKSVEGTARYCSQANVYNWAYTICDYCCPLMFLKMKPGLQCPKNVDYDSKLKDVELGMESVSIGKNKANRTWKEEQERRKIEKPLLIIDHSQTESFEPPQPQPRPVSPLSDTFQAPQNVRRPRGFPQMSSLLKDGGRPLNNEANFPALGRGKRIIEHLTKPGTTFGKTDI